MFKRILQGLALTVVAFSVSLAVSAPAQADTTPETAAVAGVESGNDFEPKTSSQCQDYIKKQGYAVGPLVRGACNKGVTNYSACYDHFITKTDVWPWHARPACSLAGIV